MSTPSRYAVAVRGSGNNATGARHCNAHLWNPHGTKTIIVREVWYSHVGTLGDISAVYLVTTTGTATSTVTPDADNAFDRANAPPSGCLVYNGTFSVEPTPATIAIAVTTVTSGIVGDGWMWTFPRGVCVPPSHGCAVGMFGTTAPTPQADITFIWDE